MSRHAVDPRWFCHLRTTGLSERLHWLTQLRPNVDSIVNFGCWNSSEPLALLWILDAAEVVVVEKEERHLTWPKEELEVLRKREPQSIDGRSVSFITADMSTHVPGLPSDSCDLAYCENVLYEILNESGMEAVQAAIDSMVRSVKAGAWIIAVEPKLGADFTEGSSSLLSRLFGCDLRIPLRVSDPLDISSLFEATGLTETRLADAPVWSYCYKKPD